MTSPVLRLIADDLTGALDSAAEFSALCGAVPVRWSGGACAGSVAISTGTREATREEAFARVRAAAGCLADADIAFKKLDSLLRGHPGAELAACVRAGQWRHVVLAPAFPAQGRVTRGGQQYARQADGSWRAVGAPLAALIAAERVDGVIVCDAESDAELRHIATRYRDTDGPTLWCGSGGLARALAGAPLPLDTTLRAPVLGLSGSDQPTTLRQLAACDGRWLRLREGEDAARVGALLGTGAALVSVALPAGIQREAAAQRIAQAFAGLVHALPAPGTLLVAGGETLRAVCDALGATALQATGLVAPGVPRSVMRGGRWDGLMVVSKSGAFGGDTLWRDLLAANGILDQRRTA